RTPSSGSGASPGWHSASCCSSMLLDGWMIFGFFRVTDSRHLRKDRVGQHSIRINDQYRICFVWRSGDAYEVEVTDYH
ncbi:MAG: type II toxin-antitoxin system RelE/ParE family toxin, partial [Terriglobales bacterium]